MADKWLAQHVKTRLLSPEGADVQALFASYGFPDISLALYPRPSTTGGDDGEPNEQTPTPFIVLRENAVSNPNDLQRSGWQFYVYDKPRLRYTRVKEIERALIELYHRWLLPVSEAGWTQWVRAEWLSSSNDMVDEAWNLHMKIVRFTCYGG